MIDRRGIIGGGAALAATAGLSSRALAAGGKDPVINRIMVSEGRVWMAAKINGKGPFLFIIDTGATLSFIEEKFAREQALEKIKGRPMTGYAGKVVDRDWWSAKEVMLASGTRFPDMLFTGVDRRIAPEAVGSFGSGLFTTFDSDLDFAKGEWRAYPDGRPNFDGLTRLPSRLTKENGGQRIEVDATLDGFDADFLVDTGAPGLSLNGRLAERSGFWNSGKPYAPYTARGLGENGVPARLYRVARTKIGPYAFEDLLVTVNAPGTYSSGKQDGLIGLSLLAQLNLTTDVSAGLLYATPNGAPVARERYPLSGLALSEDKGRVTVSDVGIGSPAAKAGVQKGDVLLGGDRETLQKLVSGGPGKPVKLQVERGGAQQEISYTLALWL